MSIASIKSDHVKKHALLNQVKSVSATTAAKDQSLGERNWVFASLLIILVGASLRLYKLNLVPFHHDEGVNGNFLVHLVRDGVYHYDPANYHGPTLYYFAALIPWTLRALFGAAIRDSYGLTSVTARLVPALFGLGTIWLVLILRRWIGSVAALSAAALLAVSPGAVYLSRYFIHETLFVFFTLGIVVGALTFFEEGHPIYLILTAASAALLFATKETAIISVGVLVIAFAITQIYTRFIRKSSGASPKRKRRTRGSGENPTILQTLIERSGGPGKLMLWLLAAAAVFIGLNVIFYSSFFTYWHGVVDSLKTFQFWTKTGKEAHVHSLTTYMYWLLQQESPLLFLGITGAALVVWRPANTFALFSALWAFGLIAAYSLIAYKTPWLTLNFIVPLALISGHVFQVLYDAGRAQLRLVVVVGVIALGINGYQTIDLNFFNYDNDDAYYVYVYAHTRRELLQLLQEIDRISQQSKEGALTGITIVSPDYWPLPWYLRDYTRVGYYGQMVDSHERIIIASESQGAEAQTRFGSRYEQVRSNPIGAGSYPLRPGVNLLLYVRRDSP